VRDSVEFHILRENLLATMADWENDESDEFFGEIDQNETKWQCNDDQGHKVHSGLMLAEQEATKKRFHTLGYHQAYDENESVRLQPGFEAGYQESYSASFRIGELLGKAAMEALHPKDSISNSREPKAELAEPPAYLEAVTLVREALSKEEDCILEELECQVKESLNRV
jgi:hypothetical protein